MDEGVFDSSYHNDDFIIGEPNIVVSIIQDSGVFVVINAIEVDLI